MAITVLLWGLLLALLVLRRLRQLLVVLVAWILQGFVIQYLLGPLVQRPRPFGVAFRGDWYAWALPSEQLAALVFLVAVARAVELLPGWSVLGANARNGWSGFTLNHDQAGTRAMVVRLTPACDPAGATEMPSQRPRVRHYERTERRTDRFTATGTTSSQVAASSPDAPLVLGFASRQALQHTLTQRSSRLGS